MRTILCNILKRLIKLLTNNRHISCCKVCETEHVEYTDKNGDTVHSVAITTKYYRDL